jgi:hypothetical protein
MVFPRAVALHFPHYEQYPAVSYILLKKQYQLDICTKIIKFMYVLNPDNQ